MGVGLRRRLAWLAGGLVGLGLLVGPGLALAQYQPGQDHVYPLYYPEDDVLLDGPGYPGPPAPITGITGGRFDASNCQQHAVHKSPPGYTTRYDCRTIQDSLVMVPGHSFRVRREILPQTQAILRDLNQYLAANGQSPVTAWGHRSFANQVRLRLKNGCPDVWQSSSRTCRIHTARPGYSRHETGQALDFHRGSSAVYWGDLAFDWLANNAGNYGFYNYAPEPWHWSIDGR